MSLCWWFQALQTQIASDQQMRSTDFSILLTCTRVCLTVSQTFQLSRMKYAMAHTESLGSLAVSSSVRTTIMLFVPKSTPCIGCRFPDARKRYQKAHLALVGETSKHYNFEDRTFEDAS